MNCVSMLLLMKDNAQFNASRCHAFCCDVVSDCLSHVMETTVDIATIIFCLSAIHPSKMIAVLQNIYSVSLGCAMHLQ